MKKVYMILLALVLVAGINKAHAQQHTKADLIGKWVGADSTGSIEVLDDKQVKVNLSGLQIPTTYYTADFSNSPIWFDVQISTSKTAKGLLRFIDANTIKWQIFLNGERPLDFKESNDQTVILKRKK